MKNWKKCAIFLLLLLTLTGCAAGMLPGFDRLSVEPEPPARPTAPAQPAGEDAAQTPPAEPEGPAGSEEPAEPEQPAEDPAVTAAREAALAEARALADGCSYDEALALLADPAVANGETEALAAEIAAEQAALVPYDGPVRHIFFHSLIVDPARAFDGGASSEGYDMWMTTRDEFVAMLPLLEARGYMLVDYEDLIQRNDDGTISPATLLLPPGRMPLVLSVDDVCYYDYMAGDGFATRLVVDADGRVATEVDGQITRDGDVVPILDDYVATHPGFSYRGARGILAVTGYEGVFGYRITHSEGQALVDAKAGAAAVSEALRASGWRIASHSYTHNSYFQDGSVTMDELRSDTDRWRTRLEPVIGATNLYISPFGMHLPFSDERFDYLLSQGYDVYCPVSMAQGMTWSDRAVIHERFNLDGYTMRNRQEEIAAWFFDPSAVYDPARPTPLP